MIDLYSNADPATDSRQLHFEERNGTFVLITREPPELGTPATPATTRKGDFPLARRNRKLAGLVPQVPKSGYGLLRALLDCFSACSEDLAATLDSPHEKGGNPGYPARQMLRLNVLKYLLGERHAKRFLDRVGNDPRLLELCGLSNVPSERAFSDFKNKKLAPHQEELDPSSPSSPRTPPH